MKPAGACVDDVGDSVKRRFGTLAADLKRLGERRGRRRYINTVHRLLRKKFQIRQLNTIYGFHLLGVSASLGIDKS